MKSPRRFLTGWFIVIVAFATAFSARATSLLENLGRGVVVVRATSSSAYIGWRVLGTDPNGVAFNLYRTTGGGAPVLLNASPLNATSDFTDATADLTQSNAYFVRPLIGGTEGAASATFTLPANAPVQQFLSLPLQIPANGITPDGTGYAYTANDCSVADLDGDGEYEIIVKWDPTNSKDNSQAGYTGNVFLDAYKLDGTRLWRIDLGRNIRAGAHYTQFLVYDFDGDGRAELVCKTAPNTKDGTGAYIGQPGHFAGTPSGGAPINHDADYRNSDGYVLTGPEFFTVFDGLTGAELASANYIPPRNNNPASGDVTAWGDNYGNRVDRFLGCVAYLDGQRPSFVLTRGYYTRAVLAAWDWRGGQLTQRWVFDTGNTGTASPLSAWRGQGAHSLTVGDVDGDGRDEITFGAAAIDDDGTGLYSTTLGHGDALHLSDMDPSQPGQEVWMVHEDPGSYGPTGLEFRDARTGELIFGLSGQGADVGRGVAGDIDPRYPGYEMWGARGGLMSANGTLITPNRPGQMNFMVWWDSDPLREILDGTTISKWDWNTNTSSPLLAPSGVSSNNGTKSTPALSVDIFGDWREEVIWRTSDSSALRIYTTTIPATNRMYTLMHDRQYRLAIAWQNVGYNQPPHPSFFIGDGMSAPPTPDIVTSLGALPASAPAVTSINRYDPATASTGATSVKFRVTFNTPVTGVDAFDFVLTTTGSVTGTIGAVSSVSGSTVAYDVPVTGITGTGTIRVDLRASGTGIASTPGGTPISGGFTSGQVYTRATLAWINANSGGLWSNPANWDGGVIANGAGAVPIFGNFDLTSDNTVVLDSARTIGGLTFGDTDTASAASWTISDAGSSNNVLTLDMTSGVPTATVNALGAGATATLDVALAGSDGIAKSGAGTLVLTKPELLTGQVNVTAGRLRLDTGSSLAASTVSVSAGGGTLDINGGTFSASSNTTVNGNGGSLLVNGGSAAFATVATNNTTNGLIRVNGGAFSASSINLPRSSDGSPSFSFGFVVTGGTANVTGNIGIGTNNSWGSMSVEGGAVTVGGVVMVGNQATSGRGGQFRVTGGTFTSTNTGAGLQLALRNNNVANVSFLGGVSTIEKITLGASATVPSTGARGNVTLGGGTLYLGSGGIVKPTDAGLTANLLFGSGTVGAKASWSTDLPITLTTGGDLTFAAANAAGDPFDIALAGALSGPGGFTKTGGGTLTLSADNTFTGAVNVLAGTVNVTGNIGAGAAITLNGGTLAGSGSIGRDIILNTARIAPDGSTTLSLGGTSLTWNGGGTLAVDVGASGSSGRIAVGGALLKGSDGGYVVAFTPTTGFAPGNSYTLATFGSTTFTAADFTAAGLPAGYQAYFAVDAHTLQVTVKAPATIALSSLRQFYDGNARVPVATTNPSGLNVVFTYDGSPIAPALPGSYAIGATIQDAAYFGSTTGTLVVNTTALTRHAPSIAGSIDGAAQLTLGENLTLTGDLSNDLLLPGTPTVRINGHPSYVAVQDASGATTPSGYTVTLNGGSVVRYLVRRVDPVALPSVTPLQSPAGTRDVVLKNANDSAGDFATLRNLTLNGGAGARAVPPGVYGNFAANGGSSFVFGVAGSATAAVYELQNLILNGGAKLDVVGPVLLKLAGSLTLNASAGSAAQPRWLTLQVANGGVTLNLGATLHGEVIAPAGTVILDSGATLNGNVSADGLTINAGGLLHQTAP